MPLYKSLDVNSQTHVKIWHISESLDALRASINLKKDLKSIRYYGIQILKEAKKLKYGNLYSKTMLIL